MRYNLKMIKYTTLIIIIIKLNEFNNNNYYNLTMAEH